MSSVSPIVWELGLVVVSLVVFAVWQTVTLRRDMERTRREREAREAAERTGGADAVDPDRSGGT